VATPPHDPQRESLSAEALNATIERFRLFHRNIFPDPTANLAVPS
jgi:hypothetical protein